MKRFSIFTTIIAVILTACANPTQVSTVTQQPTATREPTTEEIVRGFFEAYSAFDAEQAITYLSNDADIEQLISSVGVEGVKGTSDEFRLLLSWLEANGYKQTLYPCETVASSAKGTTLRCKFDFHIIRSDEIGLGPFSGSHFLIAIRNGEISRISTYWELEEFSPQMWEPFAKWMFSTYASDAEVMYVNYGSGARLSEESIRLWELHSQEYVNVATVK